MVVGAGIIILRIHGCHSLKGKRKVVKAMVDRIQNRFNVSVAEVGLNDTYSRAEIGFSLVSNDKKRVNAKIEHIFNFAEQLRLAEIIDSDMEIINL